MNLIRNDVLNLVPYQAGKPIEETKRELGLKEVIKLASNENPLGSSPKAVAAMRKVLTQAHRYPDSQGFYLKRKLAEVYKVAPANIVLGNGSDELIDIVIKTFVEHDEEIVTADTTFLEYAIIAKVNGRKVVTVPLRDFTYDLPALLKAVTPKTKLIFIANPNNPTGTYVSQNQLQEFLRQLPAHVAVVLDEAYDAFIDVKDFPQSLSYITRPQGQAAVLLLKTFSKAYGLAGLRVGYCIASDTLCSYMERVRQPFNVNIFAQAGALAALDDAQFLKNTKSAVRRGKKYFYAEFKKLGLRCVSSVANFILIDAGQDGVEVFKAMLRQGLIVRDMKQYGLKNFVRITIGTESENKKCIKALKIALGK